VFAFSFKSFNFACSADVDIAAGASLESDMILQNKNTVDREMCRSSRGPPKKVGRDDKTKLAVATVVPQTLFFFLT